MPIAGRWELYLQISIAAADEGGYFRMYLIFEMAVDWSMHMA